MSYLTFHFVFTLPAILVLGLTQPRPLAGIDDVRARWAIPLICVIAFSYTTPWDNYLVANEIWWYGPNRVWATWGYVPIEEYMFFVLQPILTGLFLYHYLGRWHPYADFQPVRTTVGFRPSTTAWTSASILPRLSGLVFFGGLGLLGAYLITSGWDPGLYMGLILAWACPVLAGMWLYDGPRLWRERRTIFVGTGLPTLYLWIADATAIHLGIWTISDQYSLGFDPFGLPVEEATFFLVTNLLVVQGILLFLPDLQPAKQPASAWNGN
jgi:lycopene cyclase domain-containing protein